jgi:hypothetical protein
MPHIVRFGRFCCSLAEGDVLAVSNEAGIIYHQSSDKVKTDADGKQIHRIHTMCGTLEIQIRNNQILFCHFLSD